MTPDDSVMLRFVRLRLPGYRRPVHILREAGPLVEGTTWSGAENLFTSNRRVHAAYSRSRLRRDYEAQHQLRHPEAPVLILDVTRCRRNLQRPHSRWSGTTRGTLVQADDLLWDAAASLDDNSAGEAIRDPDGFHAQYLYVWGDRAEPLSPSLRLRHWDERIDWLRDNLDVVDRLDRQHLARR